MHLPEPSRAVKHQRCLNQFYLHDLLDNTIQYSDVGTKKKKKGGGGQVFFSAKCSERLAIFSLNLASYTFYLYTLFNV